MSLSAIVVYVVLWNTDAPHNHHNWLMRLFAGQMFGKIHLDPKNKGFAFLLHNIDILCGFTNNTNSSSKKYIFCPN